MVCWMQASALCEPPVHDASPGSMGCVQEETLSYVVEDLEAHVNKHAGQHDAGAFKAPVQFVDEGLVQNLIVLCDRIQNSGIALKLLILLERTLKRLPAPPADVARSTTASGTRAPMTTTYLAAIHACCGELAPCVCP